MIADLKTSAQTSNGFAANDKIKNSYNDQNTYPAHPIGYKFDIFFCTDENLGNIDLINSFWGSLFCNYQICIGQRPDKKDRILAEFTTLNQKNNAADAFLILGHRFENNPRVACYGHYFHKSKSILIETIWIGFDLHQDGYYKIPGLQYEVGDDQVRKSRIQHNIETVLSWMLTLGGLNSYLGTSGLGQLYAALLERGKNVESVMHLSQIWRPSVNEQPQKYADDLRLLSICNTKKIGLNWPLQINNIYYHLLTFTDSHSQKGELEIKSDVVLDFLKDYQSFFGNTIQFPEESLSAYYLNQIPKVARPRFLFNRFSISFEIVVDEDYLVLDSPLAFDDDSKFCHVAHSGETDLFSYRYQARPPYYTKLHSQRNKVRVRFPSSWSFISEGRAEQLYQMADGTDTYGRFYNCVSGQHFEIELEACVSYTYFDNSKIRVWHLVLRAGHDPISEWELIKLMKFFSGSQEYKSTEEREAWLEQIQFSLNSNATDSEHEPLSNRNLIDLLTTLANVKYHPSENQTLKGTILHKAGKLDLSSVTSGVIELDIGGRASRHRSQNNQAILESCGYMKFFAHEDYPGIGMEKADQIHNEIRKLFKDLYHGNIQADSELESFSVQEYADYFFKVCCGVCLGIFDFGRMGFQETDDTLVPLEGSKTEKSFIALHRGVLAMIGLDDNVLHSFWDTLGANAYLLIPSAVLAHNDLVAKDAEARLDAIRSKKHPNVRKRKRTIQELSTSHKEIESLLNNDILGNVFQYKTEQEIFTVGMKNRGIDERINSARKNLDALAKQIAISHEESTRNYQRIITILVAVVGLIGSYSAFHTYFEDLNGLKPYETSNFPDWYVTVINFAKRGIVSATHLAVLVLLAIAVLLQCFRMYLDPENKKKTLPRSDN